MNEASVIVDRWGQFFNEGNAAAIAGLYAPGPRSGAPLAPSPTTTPKDIRTYFVEAARAGLRFKLGEHVASLSPRPVPSMPANMNSRATRTDRR